MNFPSKNARSAAAAMADRAAPVANMAASTAALAVADMAQATTHQLGGLDRTRTVCDVRPSAEAFEAHAALARRIVENAATAYNAGRSLTADMVRHLADIVSDRHLAEAPAAGVFQKGLSRNPSQLQPQAGALLDAARSEGLAPAA